MTQHRLNDLGEIITEFIRILAVDHSDASQRVRAHLISISSSRDARAIASPLKMDRAFYDEVFLSTKESKELQAAAALVVMVAAIDGQLAWMDVERAARTILEQEGNLSLRALCGWTAYLTSVLESADVGPDVALTCSLARAMVFAALLRKSCAEALERLESAGQDLGDEAVARVLAAWSATDRAVLGGSGGADSLLRRLRERIRAQSPQ